MKRDGLKKLDQSTIIVKELKITVKINANKRQLIINEKGDVIDTKPIRLKDGIIISDPVTKVDNQRVKQQISIKSPLSYSIKVKDILSGEEQYFESVRAGARALKIGKSTIAD